MCKAGIISSLCSPIILNNECLRTLPIVSGQFAKKEEDLSNKLCIINHMVGFSWILGWLQYISPLKITELFQTTCLLLLQRLQT